MRSQILHQLDYTGELLQFYTATDVVFAEADDSIASTGIGTATFSVGDYISVAGSEVEACNATWLVKTVVADKIVIDGVMTADDAGETITINQEYIGAWVNVDEWAKLVGSINCSGDATIYIDQSGDKSNVDYTSSWAVTGGTSLAYSTEVVQKYARMRIRNNGADQSIMRAYMNGRAIS